MEEKFLTVEQLRNKAHEQYINLLKENKLTALLRAIGYFTDQTIANDVLILNANPNATCVKRMKEWNYYNRKVLKSEKAIKVISPVKEIHNEIITDENGNTYSQDVEKLVNEVGFLFDISQTEGVDYPYLNSNKETLSSFFEEVKKSLENTSKGFTFEYVNQEEKSKIDWDKKVIYIQDGLSVGEVINELIKDTAETLLSVRKNEGLEDKKELEENCVIYAINSKLGLDLPDYDFSTANMSPEEMDTFNLNLQKVRSVTKQILSNLENSIEYSIRKAEREKKMQKTKEKEKEESEVM